MKPAARFYKTVTVAPCEGGLEVLLDGRRLKTPGKLPLIVENRRIADLLHQEWDAQIDTIKPETMPVTRLINVAIERTPINRDALIAEARKYGETDVLCYRAIKPERLTAEQAHKWDPVLEWASGRGFPMRTAHGIVAIDQDEATLDAIADYARTHDHIALTLLVHFTAVFGSVILAIAVIENHLSAEESLALSRLDELFQIDQWGEDEEAQIRTQNIYAETLALAAVVKAL